MNGFIGREAWLYLPFLIEIGWLGRWLKKKLLVYIPQDSFKQFSRLLILTIGCVTLLRALA